MQTERGQLATYRLIVLEHTCTIARSAAHGGSYALSLAGAHACPTHALHGYGPERLRRSEIRRPEPRVRQELSVGSVEAVPRRDRAEPERGWLRGVPAGHAGSNGAQNKCVPPTPVRKKHWFWAAIEGSVSVFAGVARKLAHI